MRDTPVLAVQLDVSILERDDPVAFVEGERRVDVLLNEREEPGGHRDADRDPEPADDRQGGILDQHPKPEDEIEAHAGEPVEPARVAHFFLEALDAAERDPRATSGFLATRSVGARDLRRFHLEVEAQLLVHVGLGAAAPEDRAEALARCPVDLREFRERTHADLPSQARTQFSAVDARSHCARSRASSPAPARVST